VIALNRVRAEETYHRAGKRDLRRTVSGAPDGPFDVPDANDRHSFMVLQLTVEESLAQLPPHQREMLELRIQGHEVAEIARAVGRSKRTVERNLQEVRTRLRTLLETPNADVPLDATQPPPERAEAGDAGGPG
jgi:RNA polymerase sigma factor (sigma-70 family)